jgi:hypothetical protein
LGLNLGRHGRMLLYGFREVYRAAKVKAASVGGLAVIGLHHLQSALILFEHGPHLLEPLESTDCCEHSRQPVSTVSRTLSHETAGHMKIHPAHLSAAFAIVEEAAANPVDLGSAGSRRTSGRA